MSRDTEYVKAVFQLLQVIATTRAGSRGNVIIYSLHNFYRASTVLLLDVFFLVTVFCMRKSSFSVLMHRRFFIYFADARPIEVTSRHQVLLAYPSNKIMLSTTVLSERGGAGLTRFSAPRL